MGDEWYTEEPAAVSQSDVDWEATAARLVGDSPFAALAIFLVWWLTQDLGKRLDKIHECLDELRDDLKERKL